MSDPDNPLWSSLTTSHAALARRAGDAARYPADVAPFLAVAHEGAAAGDLVAPGEMVLMIGPRAAVPAGWRLEDHGEILQMVCARVPEAPAGPPVGELGPDDGAAIQDLAALVYPHYFRPRTPALGRYFGIRAGDVLVAMIGERMGMPGYRELSAVCTHPDFTGRGLARRLLAHVAGDLAARGVTPFLHVSPTNTRAIQLYEQNGFRVRRTIPFAALHRPG